MNIRIIQIATLSILICVLAAYNSPSQEYQQLRDIIFSMREVDLGFASQTYLAQRDFIHTGYGKLVSKVYDTSSSEIKLQTVNIENCDSFLKGYWVLPKDLPNENKDQVILYFHGGGVFLGNFTMYEGLTSTLAHELKRKILFLEYDLVPEATFFNQVKQGVCAYRWLLQNQKISPQNLFIFADNTGGNLALLVLQKLVKLKIQVPRGVVLNSPFTDLSFSGESYQTNAYTDLITHNEVNVKTFQWVVGKDFQLQDPSVSSLFGDFSGLPPLYFFVGGDEMLLSDTLRAASKARSQGVKVRTEVQPYGIAVYSVFPTPEGKKARENMKFFLDELSQKDKNSKQDL